MKNYREEFDRLLTLLKERTPFAFSRFSDGEVTILRNKTVVLAEDHFIQGDIHGEQKYILLAQEQQGLDQRLSAVLGLQQGLHEGILGILLPLLVVLA